MKSVLVVFVLFFASLSVSAQNTHTREEVVEHLCHASEVTSGPEFQRIVNIRQRLAPVLERVQGYDVHVAVVDSQDINAYTFNLKPRSALICIPTGIVRFMGQA